MAVPSDAMHDATVALGATGAHHRRIGTFGGDAIEVGGSALPLAEASEIWRNAIPRRMH